VITSHEGGGDYCVTYEDQKPVDEVLDLLSAEKAWNFS
jgi:hypothetical protein